MALALGGESGVVLLLGRPLFGGGGLAFVGLNHFAQTDEMAGYAEVEGVPVSGASVLLSGGMLLVGGLSVWPARTRRSVRGPSPSSCW